MQLRYYGDPLCSWCYAPQTLGVSGFPTVALSHGEELYLVTSGFVTHDVLEYRVAEIERLALAKPQNQKP